MSTDTSNKQGYKWISPRVKELTDKLSRENKNDVVRIVVDYHVNKNEKETIDKLRVVGAKYSRENDNETARNVAEIATIIMGKKSKMAQGGSIEVGDKVKATKEYGGKSGVVIEKRGSFVVVEDSKGKTESYHESDLVKKMAEGGMVDLFEDYENIPANVQSVLDEYAEDFEDGNYQGMQNAKDEIEQLGYTFDFYVDGSAYGLRPIGVELNELEGYEEYKKGGTMKNENNEMLRNQVVEAKHHVAELAKEINSKTNVEPWVVAKMERATTDLSDVTHYLDGMQKMAFGGMINDLSDDTIDRMEGLVPNSTLIEFLNNAIYIINDMEQEGFEKDEIMSFLSYKMVQMQKMEHGGKIEIGSIIYVSKEPYMASLSNLYDKPLKVVDIKSFNFATGPKLYYIVETEDGQEEVSEDFVIEQMEHGGSMYAVGGEILNRNITFEDWKGDTRTGKVISILDNGDYEVATDSGMALVTSDEIIKMKKGGYVPKSKKLTAQQQAKLEKVLHEYKMGELHSGSSTGPIVKSRKQALAIGLAEARSMAKGGEVEPLGWKHKDAVEYGKKLVDNGAKTIEIRNKIEENYAGLRGEIQSIMNDVLDYKDSKMAQGGEIEVDMNEVEKSAIFYTDESKWSPKPTISKFE